MIDLITVRNRKKKNRKHAVKSCPGKRLPARRAVEKKKRAPPAGDHLHRYIQTAPFYRSRDFARHPFLPRYKRRRGWNSVHYLCISASPFFAVGISGAVAAAISLRAPRT